MLRQCCSSSKNVISKGTAPKLLRRPGSSIQYNVRHASSGGGGSGGKFVGAVIGLSAVGAAGVVGYSSVDLEFRKMVEANIPGSDQVLDAVLGEKTPPAPVKPITPPSKLKIGSPIVYTKPKEEKPVKTEAKPAVTEDAVVAKTEEKKESSKPSVAPMTVPSPPLETPPQEKIPEKKQEPKIEVEQPKESKPEPVTEKPLAPRAVKESKPEGVNEEKPAAEPSHDIENSSLELMLGELCQEMNDSVNAMIEDLDAAAKATAGHIELMEKVLESSVSAKDESKWNEMFSAAQNKSEKNKNAENSEKKVKQAMANVAESIAAGRKNKITSTNPKLLEAEESVNKAIYNIDQAKVRRASVESQAKIMEDYRDIVEAGREEFHKEMASIMPDVRPGEKNGKLTEEELNMFITHAYRKVMFLQQELAKQQTVEQERFRKALEKQRMDTTSLAVDQLDNELEKQARELHVEHEKRLAAIKEEAEMELRVQMKRQAAAHADHITDVLAVQEAELARKLTKEHQEVMDAMTGKYNESLAKLGGVVGGLKGGLEARAGADEASKAAQSLWVASSKLSTIVNNGNVSAKTWEEKLTPLGGAVKTVTNVAGKDKFVSTVCSSIPAVALQRGVYTEDNLKERFCKVEKTARKVAGVGEQGGSLISFGLSYLQSLLLVDLSKRAPVDSMEVVDLNSMSSYDLLSLARHNLDRGDLARAVQLLTQLRGESARVVSDWLTEARLTLETKQAVSAIMAHSLVASCNNMISN